MTTVQGWLNRAAGALRRGRAVREEPFEIVSSVGRTVRGFRTDRPQVVHCPITGERLFVLPLDAYPLPRGVPDPKSRDGRRRREGRSPQPTRPTERKPRPTKPKRSPPRAVATPRKRGPGIARSGLDWGRRSGERVRRWFTPLRSVVIAMLVVVGVTSWFAMRSAARRDAEITLRTASAEAWEAVDREEWDTARERFADAVDALEVLGLEDASLSAAERELEASRFMPTVPLLDVLADADRTLAAGGEAAWTERFDGMYAGRWIVVDAWVAETVDEIGRPTVFVEYPLSLDGVPLDLQVDAEAFAGLNLPSGSDADPQRILFAAQLQQLLRTDGPLPRWRLRLRSETAFPWVHRSTLDSVGLAPPVGDAAAEAELTAVLERQALVAGVPE